MGSDRLAAVQNENQVANSFFIANASFIIKKSGEGSLAVTLYGFSAGSDGLIAGCMTLTWAYQVSPGHPDYSACNFRRLVRGKALSALAE